VSPPLARITAADPPPFALVHRAGAPGGDGGGVDVLLGETAVVDRLSDIPLSDRPPSDGTVGAGRHEVLALVPYRQLAERGYHCVDDGERLVVMTVTDQEVLPAAQVLARLPDEQVVVEGGGFDLDDETYAELVRTVVNQEIGCGAGSNFVLRRSFVADITGFTPRVALAMFRRLMERESGAYWTFVIHTGERTLVGASPERHISVAAGTAVMNPISGTYRYPPSGPSLPEVIEFLADPKETDELYMVVDEELKMMGRICESGGRVLGPYLREMAKLAHTEYYIEGRTTADVREILLETMFAPTVAGSPLENACRVIERHERGGRGYYSGVAALVGRDADGLRAMDSAILIRTADIDAAGRMRIGVGSTLVRHSRPMDEVAETRAKAAGLLTAFSAGETRFGGDPQVQRVLSQRNERIAQFWLHPAAEHRVARFAGRRVLVVDAEDTFTAMIGHLLRSLGLSVTIGRFDEPFQIEDHDLVVLGPGPGDPLDDTDPRIAVLAWTVRRLLGGDRPFLAVCLSHQILCRELGLRLSRRSMPNQGVQREIDLFGRLVRVGFYNSFAASCPRDEVWSGPGRGIAQICRDSATGEVHAVRGRGFYSLQFHAESVLSRDGLAITRDVVGDLIAGRDHHARPGPGKEELSWRTFSSPVAASADWPLR
jgi:phenazine biosynthesis protein phzE